MIINKLKLKYCEDANVESGIIMVKIPCRYRYKIAGTANMLGLN